MIYDRHNDKLSLLAADLVSRQVAVIAAAGGAVAGLAAKAATSTIPIVVATGDDPVKYGLVASLSRPTGNITGVTLFIDVLAAKRVEILTEFAPTAALAILVNPRNPNAETEARDARAAVQQSGRELRVLTASNEGEIDAAFATLAQQAGAVASNVLDRAFKAAAPNRKWIADFTYVWTAEGWLYVAASSTSSPGVWWAGR